LYTLTVKFELGQSKGFLFKKQSTPPPFWGFIEVFRGFGCFAYRFLYKGCFGKKIVDKSGVLPTNIF